MDEALATLKQARINVEKEAEEKKRLKNIQDRELGEFYIDASALKIMDDDEFKEFKKVEEDDVKSLIKNAIQKKLKAAQEAINKVK